MSGCPWGPAGLSSCEDPHTPHPSPQGGCRPRTQQPGFSWLCHKGVSKGLDSCVRLFLPTWKRPGEKCQSCVCVRVCVRVCARVRVCVRVCVCACVRTAGWVAEWLYACARFACVPAHWPGAGRSLGPEGQQRIPASPASPVRPRSCPAPGGCAPPALWLSPAHVLVMGNVKPCTLAHQPAGAILPRPAPWASTATARPSTQLSPPPTLGGGGLRGAHCMQSTREEGSFR